MHHYITGFDIRTYILLFIGRDGGDISSEAAIAATVDLLIVVSSRVQAHTLISSLLHQGSFHALDLQDLGLDVWGEEQQSLTIWAC